MSFSVRRQMIGRDHDRLELGLELAVGHADRSIQDLMLDRLDACRLGGSGSVVDHRAAVASSRKRPGHCASRVLARQPVRAGRSCGCPARPRRQEGLDQRHVPGIERQPRSVRAARRSGACGSNAGPARPGTGRWRWAGAVAVGDLRADCGRAWHASGRRDVGGRRADRGRPRQTSSRGRMAGASANSTASEPPRSDRWRVVSRRPTPPTARRVIWRPASPRPTPTSTASGGSSLERPLHLLDARSALTASASAAGPSNSSSSWICRTSRDCQARLPQRAVAADHRDLHDVRGGALDHHVDREPLALLAQLPAARAQLRTWRRRPNRVET